MRTNTYKTNNKVPARKKFLVRLVMFLVLIGFSATSGLMLHANANQEATAEATNGNGIVVAEENEESGLAGASIVCVEPGDTLWKIAKAYGPDDVSVKAYVQRIMEANGMEYASLQVGQVIRLP
jgi:nucleoid-associated protein YgaU